MNFQQQTIILDGNKGKFEVEAMVAPGIGLAYHPNLNTGEDASTYLVTHIGSGHNILKSRNNMLFLDPLPDELSAQRFVEAIAHVVDWNLPEASLRELAHWPGQTIFVELRRAYYETVEEVDYE